MPTYTLNLAVDDAGLAAINASGQKVTIVKSVGSGEDVAWLLFEPLESNTITWEETYSVYASATNIEAGATIATQSTKVASGGNSYTFENGSFSNGVPGPGPTEYVVENQDSAITISGVEMITSGLYQGAVVNGNNTAAPLNAASVLFNETGTFTPIETIQVYLSSYNNNGLVISSVASNALTVTYTDNTVASIKFNDTTNTFEMA